MRLSATCKQCGWETWEFSCPVRNPLQWKPNRLPLEVRALVAFVKVVFAFHFFGGKHTAYEWAKPKGDA